MKASSQSKTISHVTHFHRTDGCTVQDSTDLNYIGLQVCMCECASGTTVGKKMIHTAGTESD